MQEDQNLAKLPPLLFGRLSRLVHFPWIIWTPLDRVEHALRKR